MKKLEVTSVFLIFHNLTNKTQCMYINTHAQMRLNRIVYNCSTSIEIFLLFITNYSSLGKVIWQRHCKKCNWLVQTTHKRTYSTGVHCLCAHVADSRWRWTKNWANLPISVLLARRLMCMHLPNQTKMKSCKKHWVSRKYFSFEPEHDCTQKEAQRKNQETRSTPPVAD